VQVIGKGNTHHLYIRVGYGFFHIDGGMWDAIIRSKLLCGFFPPGINRNNLVLTAVSVNGFGIKAADKAEPSIASVIILVGLNWFGEFILKENSGYKLGVNRKH
jgi:hypothetical protein